MADAGSRRRSIGKRQWCLLVCLAIGAAVVSGYVLTRNDHDGNSTVGEELSPSRWATVDTDVLNGRAGPSIDAAVLGSFISGESVRIVGDAESGFVPVAYGEGRAWLAGEYLSFDGSSQAVTDSITVQEVASHEPGSLQIATTERWIDIDRSEATVTLYDGPSPVASYVGRIGRDPSLDGYYSTAIGTFHVYSMNKGLAQTPFAEDAWLTDWVGFDPDRRNGIHSPERDSLGNEKPWQNPTTLGCVRLDAESAVAVFAFAEIGMRVEVHE